MNKTISQNGGSSPPLYDQRLNRSMPNIPSHDSPNDSGLTDSAKQSHVDHIPVSKQKIREIEVFQSREVRLKLLQPLAPNMHSKGHSLPHREEAKTCITSDVCGSYCSRCTSFQPSHNEGASNRGTSGEWDLRHFNKETCEKRLHREPQTVMNLPCNEEDLPRTGKTSVLFPIPVRCRSCEFREQQFYHNNKELHSPKSRCQHVLADYQQHSSGDNSSREDIYPNDPALPLTHPWRQIGDNRPVRLAREPPNKDSGNFEYLHPTDWRYHGDVSRICRLPPSRQNLSHEHPGTVTEGTGDAYHARAVRSVHDPDERSRLTSSSVEQDKESGPSHLMHKRYGCGAPFPSDKLLQDKFREERNVSRRKAAGENNALPHWPNQSCRGTEREMDECTPVIVHCYSLSQPGFSGDSHFNTMTTNSTNNVISKGNPRFLERHKNCINHQPTLKSHKSASGIQDTGEVLYESSLPCPRRDTSVYNHSFFMQPKYVINDASDVDIDEDDSQNHTTVVLAPGHQHEKFMPPVNCCDISFPSCPHANGCETNCTQTSRSPLSHNKGCPEPRHTPERDSHSKFIHIPNGFHRRPPAADGHKHGESGRVISSDWPETSYIRRPTVKVQDYYEERRILVGKFYHDIPCPLEVAELKKNSNMSYAGAREMIQDDHPRDHCANADVYQTPACEDGPFQIQVYEQDVAVGSKKRKNRQPRAQRVKSDSLVQFYTRGQDNELVQYERNLLQEGSNNRCYHHANSSSFKNNSAPKEVCCEIAEDIEVSNKTKEMRPRKDVQDTVHAQYDSSRRCDFESASRRSRIFRRAIPSVDPPPWHNPSEGKRSAERYDQCMARHRLHNVPTSGDNDCIHRPTNHIMGSRFQSKSSRKSFEISCEKTHLDNLSPELEWDAAQKSCHGPPWISAREKHFKSLEKESYDNEHVRCTSEFPGPSQQDTPTKDISTFPNEMNSESWRSWNGSLERYEDELGYHMMQAKDKPSSKNSKSPPSSLPDETTNASSTFIDDSEESKEMQRSNRPRQSDLADHSTNDSVAEGLTEEQNVTFSEIRNPFLHTEEMLTDYMNASRKERRFVCRYCCKKFAHFSTLQNHLRTHTGDKPFQCKFCNRRFAQSGVLKAHLRTHTGDKPFVCMYCRKTFAQSTTLTNHLRTHTGQKPYVCTFCSKSFSQPSTLRKHELSHTKERPYPCKFCGKAFAQQSTLTNHLRSHTGQRPYKCHFCEKSFAQLSTLDRHLRLHSTVSLKPHQCQYCSKSFSYFSNLASHMQVHQDEQSLSLQ